jgi:hypothetical protein
MTSSRWTPSCRGCKQDNITIQGSCKEIKYVPMTSSIWTHGNGCVPGAIVAPAPNEKDRMREGSKPALGLRVGAGAGGSGSGNGSNLHTHTGPQPHTHATTHPYSTIAPQTHSSRHTDPQPYTQTHSSRHIARSHTPPCPNTSPIRTIGCLVLHWTVCASSQSIHRRDCR